MWPVFSSHIQISGNFLEVSLDHLNHQKVSFILYTKTQVLSPKWSWPTDCRIFWSLISSERKNGPVGKTGPQGLKMLPIFSCHMKDNVEVIHLHIQHRGVQALVFVQITFEICTTNFCFENSEVITKMTIANL